MLYIVATPIGNLEDITLRAIKILQSVDIVAAEDSRRTNLLLQKICPSKLKTKNSNVKTKTKSFKLIRQQLVSIHEHTRPEKIDWLISELKNGKQVALCTDAGTPGIADPGGKVVEKALAAGIDVVPIPGPSSLSAILSITGWQNEPSTFVGYLPKKKGRHSLLTEMSKLKFQKSKLINTIILFESPHRINKTIKELAECLGGDCQAVIGRELTKQFEEITRGTLGELSNKELVAKGEYTVAIHLSA